MILQRTFTTELHVRDDDRIITGTLVPYGQPVQIREYGKTYTEDFAPGAFAADVGRAAEVELTALHPRSGAELPIGITLSLIDTSTGLDGEWRISETSFGRTRRTFSTSSSRRVRPSTGVTGWTPTWRSPATP